MRRVAITGMGAVSAMGLGVPALWDGLLAARSGVRRISLFDPSSLSVTIAAEVPGFDPAQFFPDDKIALLDRFGLLGLVAAAEALQDAGLEIDEAGNDRAGVAIGTGIGGTMTCDQEYEKLYGRRATRVHPFTIPRLMANSAASHLSMQFQLRGPTLCYTSACAAASHAIGEAAEMIRAGRVDMMMAGGCEAPLSFGMIKCWESMRVLAPANGDPASACRPFSRDRQGLVLGEGAGIVILEDWDRARERGAPIKAELAGYGATADAGHITQPGIDAPAHALRQALAQAKLPLDGVQYVNAHGTGTRINDCTETAILKRVFGEHARQLAVSSTKSMLGHTMGASGALELIATVMAIRSGVVPPTAHYREPDPDCDLDYVPNQARELPVSGALSNSFAFGGLNAVLAVTRA